MDKVQASLDKFQSDLDKYPYLNMAEEKTGVPKLYLVGGVGALFVVFLFFGFGAGLLCNLVGFIYPALMSFQAIESPNKADDTQWLTYWVVYATFNMFEVFSNAITYWIPFYYAFKFGFLIWCFLPSTQGASFLYNNFLAPFLKQHESRIDEAMKNITNATSEASQKLGNQMDDATKERIQDAVQQKLNEASQ